MAQAFTYSLKTLNGNWFEDRLQPNSTAVAGEDKFLRKVEPEIAYIGERYDVLARISRSKTRESFATPDYGFHETSTLNNEDFAHPMTRKEVVRNPPEPPKFITTETVPEVCYEERRPIPGNKRGFGAVLNRHEETEGQSFWDTAAGDAFGVGDRRPKGRVDGYTMGRNAGRSGLEFMTGGSGLQVGKLCGEDFREGRDPASDTRIQRSWLYAQDASIRNIEYGGKKPALPSEDNELSLPIGENLKLLAAGKQERDNLERRGMMYRTATTITKGRGDRYGISIFQDE